MDTLLAFRMGELNRGKERMVFDWDKAAKLIVEKRPEIAVAGLDQDLEYTADVIFDQGNIMTDARPYLASTWATPVLIMDDVSYNCYRMESEVPEWDEHTVWPDSAKDIMAKGVRKMKVFILESWGYDADPYEHINAYECVQSIHLSKTGAIRAIKETLIKIFKEAEEEGLSLSEGWLFSVDHLPSEDDFESYNDTVFTLVDFDDGGYSSGYTITSKEVYE